MRITPETKTLLVSFLLICEAVGTGVLCVVAAEFSGNNIPKAGLALILISIVGMLMGWFLLNICVRSLDSLYLRKRFSLTLFIEALAIPIAVYLVLIAMEKFQWGDIGTALRMMLIAVVASPIVSFLSLISGVRIVETYKKAWFWIGPAAIIVLFGLWGLVYTAVEIFRLSGR